MSRIKVSGSVVVLAKKQFIKTNVCSFESTIHGKVYQGFVIKRGDAFFAYRNVCRHLPVTLDLGDDKFLTHDKQHIQCHMHGAMYEVETGFCVAGPCQGARLAALPLTEEPTRVIVKISEG